MDGERCAFRSGSDKLAKGGYQKEGKPWTRNDLML